MELPLWPMEPSLLFIFPEEEEEECEWWLLLPPVPPVPPGPPLAELLEVYPPWDEVFPPVMVPLGIWMVILGMGGVAPPGGVCERPELPGDLDPPLAMLPPGPDPTLGGV